MDQTRDGSVTALMSAAGSDHFETCKVLVEQADANIFIRDYWCKTALHYAAQKGSTLICLYLMDRGADVNDIQAYYTPLMLAASQGHVKLCQALLDRKADVNAVNQNGETALITAALGGHTEVCKMLINEKANVNALTKGGQTALAEVLSRLSYNMINKVQACEVCLILIENGTTITNEIAQKLDTLKDTRITEALHNKRDKTELSDHRVKPITPTLSAAVSTAPELRGVSSEFEPQTSLNSKSTSTHYVALLKDYQDRFNAITITESSRTTKSSILKIELKRLQNLLYSSQGITSDAAKALLIRLKNACLEIKSEKIMDGTFRKLIQDVQEDPRINIENKPKSLPL